MYILSFFFSEALFVSLINYPSDILHFKFHTLLTAGFLHANLAHLVGNMLGIFVFGRVVEKHIGAQKTAFVYMGALIISGVFNALIHLFVFNDNTGGIGASGALMGLVATAMLLNPLYISYAFLFPLPIMVMGWFTLYLDIMGILTPNSSNIGHFAHVGGFLSITILMFFIQKKQQLKKGLYINIASALLIVLLYVFVVK
ncbi:MAG: rhomboid family intramembrane serine protease [Candidatus Woesearchaeota archaeon]